MIHIRQRVELCYLWLLWYCGLRGDLSYAV